MNTRSFTGLFYSAAGLILYRDKKKIPAVRGVSPAVPYPENYDQHENELFGSVAGSFFRNGMFVYKNRRYSLDRFEWLRYLSSEERTRYCRDWIDGNRLRRDVFFDHGSAAARVVNWIKSGMNHPEISRALYTQARYIYFAQGRGNDSPETAKALIYCGRYFNIPRWTGRGKEILLKVVSEGCLRDGGFKGEISAAVSLLHDLLDIINIDVSFGEILKGYAARLLGFVYLFGCGDDEYIFYNHGTDRGVTLIDLRLYAGQLGVEPAVRKGGLFRFPHSGYYGIKKDAVNIAVRGIRGNDPGLFSYELGVRGEKMITTRSSPVKNGYSRHNNIVIDGDVPKLKGYPSEIVFEEGKRLFFKCTSVRIGRTGGEDVKTFYFSGIVRSDEMMHKREIYYDDAASVVTVKDTLRGSGKHGAKSFVHIPQDAFVRINDRRILVKAGGSIMVISSENSFLLDKNILVFESALPGVIEYRIKF